jgi:L-threonylcarbamoyladenylate synthase
MRSDSLTRTYAMIDPAAREAGIAAGADALVRGLLVGMPTETVYGLAADAGNATAIASIFAAKGRPRFNPLIVHVASVGAAGEIATLDDRALRLAGAFWPGPLTIVAPRRAGAAIADLVTAGLDTIAVRVPSHPVAQSLLAAFARPIAAPSANRSGQVSATTAAHVIADLGDAVSVVLDAGPASIGIESTIVALATGEPLLLRRGAVPRREIEAVLGRSLASPVQDPGAPTAPGMLPSHYAPAARLRLAVTDVRAGEALLTFGPTVPAGADRAVAAVNLSASADLTEAATRFFAALRELDQASGTIAVVPIPDQGLGEAINERLRRAAAPRG